MTHISTAVEYALHCLLYLVDSDHRSPQLPIKDLAEMQGVSPQYLAKIFTRLKKSGLVSATEGTKGGFCLTRPAAEISVLDVVEAVDGPKPLFECQNIRERCALFGDGVPPWASRGYCSIHAVMLEAERDMKAALQNHTLASIDRTLAGKAPDDYGIEVVRWFDDREQVRQKKRSKKP